jgi:hypothetical protein
MRGYRDTLALVRRLHAGEVDALAESGGVGAVRTAFPSAPRTACPTHRSQSRSACTGQTLGLAPQGTAT